MGRIEKYLLCAHILVENVDGIHKHRCVIIIGGKNIGQ